MSREVYDGPSGICVRKIKDSRGRGGKARLGVGCRAGGSDRAPSLGDPREWPPGTQGTWASKTHQGSPSLKCDIAAEQLGASGAGPSRGWQVTSHPWGIPHTVGPCTLGKGDIYQSPQFSVASSDSKPLLPCLPRLSPEHLYPSCCSSQTLEPFLTLSVTPHTQSISKSRGSALVVSIYPHLTTAHHHHGAHLGLYHRHLSPALLQWPPSWPPCPAFVPQSILIMAARVSLLKCKSACAQNPPGDPAHSG